MFWINITLAAKIWIMANIEGFQDYSITAKIWILHFLLTSFINQTLGSTDVTSNWTSPEFNVTEQSVVTTVEDNGTTVTTATYISTAETTESEVLTTSGGALTTEGQGRAILSENLRSMS